MGNCQAAEAATVVIQHPGGRVERLYWPTSAGEVMRNNPGHYVALVFLSKENLESGGVRFTRVRLLKPKEMLFVGQVYRLITSQEVTKALRQRKYEKMKKNQANLIKEQQQQQMPPQERQKQEMDEQGMEFEARQIEPEKVDQVAKQERDHQKGSQSVARARQWRPSLQSISEVVS